MFGPVGRYVSKLFELCRTVYQVQISVSENSLAAAGLFLFFQEVVAMKKKRNKPMRCPYCGAPVVYRSADGIYNENKTHTMLYVCSRYTECDAYVRVQPGKAIPLGTLANGDLRALRREAHHYFDRLYTSGRMTKQEAYHWLATFLQVPQAHIGYLGEYTCKQVIRACKEMLGSKGGAKTS